MLQKDKSEGRQVKARQVPRSVQFAFAFHVGEEDDDCLLHSGERLRLKSMFCGPGTELGHAGSLPIGYIFVEAVTALTSAFAVRYLASVKLPSAVVPIAVPVAIPVALSVALPVVQTGAV